MLQEQYRPKNTNNKVTNRPEGRTYGRHLFKLLKCWQTFVLTSASNGSEIYLFAFLFFRTAESSSEETQKDVHREDGRNKKPVEEHRGALRQLVSFIT